PPHRDSRRPAGAWRPTPTRRDLSSAPPPTQTGGAPQEHGDQRRRDEISHQLRHPLKQAAPLRSMATNADATRSLLSSATHSNRRRPSGAWRPTPTRRDLSSAPPPRRIAIPA